METFEWRPIGDDSAELAFSAFLDMSRDSPAVRVVVLSSLYKKWFRRHVYCQLWTRGVEDGGELARLRVDWTTAELDVIPETHDRRSVELVGRVSHIMQC